LKLYLLAAPASPDAEKVKRQIYALEYRQEKAQKEVIAKREEQERKRREEEAKASDISRLTGSWCGSWMGCGWETTVSGTTIEFSKYECWDDSPRRGGECSQKTWQVVFRGNVRGNEIRGLFFVEPILRRCPDLPMTGKVLSNDRLQLTHPSLATGWPSCTVLSQPWTTTFSRQ
jgi:hypothetical protein